MDPNKTQMGSAPVADPNRTQMGSVLDPNRTIMGVGPSINATQTIKPVQCPVCKSFNPPGTAWCVDCGLIFELALDGDAFGAPAVQLPVLVDANGREHVLRPGDNVVGRQGDVLVEDTRVSRQHARVTLDGPVVTVEDLGSTNGTSVGGTRLGPGEKKTLGNGDKVSLGGFELTVSMPGETNKTLAAMGGKTSAMQAAPTTNTAVVWLVLPDSEIPLGLGTHVFGRKSDNTVVIADPYVSGRHGEIEVTESEVWLTDTGSTNGTLLNGAKLNPGQRVQLTKDDVVKLGAVEVRVRFRS
ncbi:MAG: FHA domain-containing protein [Fimbriimonadaceae bacterium]|nr:FHA domain-containing protein [Fimbriimonadaceae bacterium]